MAPLPPYLALPIAWDTYAAHLDEGSFLWRQRSRALVGPDYVLDEVAELEGRLLAHVDALVLGGRKVAARLLVPALDLHDETGVVEVATLAMLMQEDAPAASIESVLQQVLEGDEATCMALRPALRLIGTESMKQRLLPLLDSATTPALLTMSVLDLFAAWRVDPGPVLRTLLTHEEPGIRASAFRCVRTCPSRLSDESLRLGLRSSLPEVRNSALEAGLVAGMQLAWHECRHRVETRDSSPELALYALAIMGGPTGQASVLNALKDTGLQRHALRALGLLGTVEAAEAALALMRTDELAPLAAEAFSTVTGWKVAPSEIEPDPQAMSTSREPAEPSPEDDLPHPDAAQADHWWRTQSRRFERTTRYVLGRPFGQETLLGALRESSMYRRRPLALALALRTRGECVLDLDVWVRDQHAQWETARRLPTTRFLRSLEVLHG
ncbi:TIGR02270 family protein [Myxococcaceae bacterium JPH2]|nr:TIGR02270 family protein [Myxococcaceae bacterium JPH2]